MASSKRTGNYMALMFLDLDNFKNLNDNYGHIAGDLLLTQTASRLKSNVREVDTVGRFGSDEFVVILNELGLNKTGSVTQATIVAEKIRTALAGSYLLNIQHEGSANCHRRVLLHSKHRCGGVHQR